MWISFHTIRMGSLRYVKKGEKILAIVIYSNFNEEGQQYVTPDDFSLQLGVHNRKKGTIVKPHKHKDFKNIDLQFQEIVYVQAGEVEIEIFDDEDNPYEKLNLKPGDTILFNSGHSVKFLTASKIMNIKQGPYRPDEKEFI